jgi:hypothetical protein
MARNTTARWLATVAVIAIIGVASAIWLTNRPRPGQQVLPMQAAIGGNYGNGGVSEYFGKAANGGNYGNGGVIRNVDKVANATAQEAERISKQASVMAKANEAMFEGWDQKIGNATTNTLDPCSSPASGVQQRNNQQAFPTQKANGGNSANGGASEYFDQTANATMDNPDCVNARAWEIQQKANEDALQGSDKTANATTNAPASGPSMVVLSKVRQIDTKMRALGHPLCDGNSKAAFGAWACSSYGPQQTDQISMAVRWVMQRLTSAPLGDAEQRKQLEQVLQQLLDLQAATAG